MIVGNVVIADWYFFTVVAVMFVAIGAGLWWFYNSRLKRGYKAVVTALVHGVKVNINGKEEVVGGVREEMAQCEIKRSDVKAGEVRLLGRPYTVDLTKPAYRKFGWTYFFYDLDGKNILTFGGAVAVVSPDDRNKYINSGLWQRIMSLVGGRSKADLLLLVMMGVLCVVTFAVGLLASPYILPSGGNQTVFTRFVYV